MKRLMLATLIGVTFASFAAEGRAKLTPEQIAVRKYQHFGGFLYQPMETKVVSIVNDQTVVDVSVLARIASEMKDLLNVPVEVDAKANVGVVLKVCACEKLGPLVVLPDSATACVSVAKLSEDRPSKALLEERLQKELWRGLIYALGGGNSFSPQCVMKQISGLKELDALSGKVACPEVFVSALEGAGKLGIKPARRVSYRQACKEGWAPAPTNDVQRAVLERVKTEKGFEEQTRDPTKPIRIKYTPAKQ